MASLREPTQKEVLEVINQKFKEEASLPTNLLTRSAYESALRPYDTMLRERQSMYAYNWLHKQESFKRALEKRKKINDRRKVKESSELSGELVRVFNRPLDIAQRNYLRESIEDCYGRDQFHFENFFMIGRWRAQHEKSRRIGPGLGPTSDNRKKAIAALKRVRSLVDKQVFNWESADALTTAITAAESDITSIKHRPSQSLKSRLLRIVKDGASLLFVRCELRSPEVVVLYAEFCGVDCAYKTAEAYIKAAKRAAPKARS